MHPSVHSSTVYNHHDMEAICSLTGEWIKKMWYIYNRTLAIKIMKYAICSNTDGPGDYHIK